MSTGEKPPGEFANYPQSVTELRADRKGDATLWTPRDVLLHLLRDIDAGNLNVVGIVVCMRIKTSEGFLAQYRQSGEHVHTTLGIVEMCKAKIFGDILR